MKSEEVYVQCIYSRVKEIVEEYNRTIKQMLTPKPPEEKRKAIRRVKHGKKFVGVFQREEDIPDEFFTKFFNITLVDETITREVEKYEMLLGIEYTQGEFNIRDLVTNPKANGRTYIEALDRLYDKTDSIDYYERTFKKHMFNLKRNWLLFNGKTMCLWGSTFKKIGDKFYISNANGSHLTCLCKLIQISGMTDEYFDMPEGFIESLKSIRTVYKNTPDDLEFVLMFNRMYELIKIICPEAIFYLKDSSEKGKNTIGIVGTDIEISTVSDIINFLKAQQILIKGNSDLKENIELVRVTEKVVGEE